MKYMSHKATTTFQSHNGAIAASGGAQCAAASVSFNPTMVRLLRGLELEAEMTGLLFQSHNGAIAAVT